MVRGPAGRQMVKLPRVVIAAPATGQGKTTIATGLMAALTGRGLSVSGHKVGPDYIDPGYHALATGRPGRNLDPFLVGEDLVTPLLLHGAQGAEVAVVEGVMGLYDGLVGGEGFASTAHVAALTRTPIILVVDITYASRSIAAVVHGMSTFQPDVTVAGVVLNKAGHPRHAAEVSRAVESAGVPVLGVLPRDDGIQAPSRHLGLVPAAERGLAAESLDALSEHVAAHVDLDAVLDVARKAPELDAKPWDPAAHVSASSHDSPVVAVAAGRAFTFRYAETTELLAAAGCTIATFDPARDTHLPSGTRGLYLGGGFPEMHASALTDNASLRAELRQAVLDGVPTIAECAGLLYLCRSLDGKPMVGAIDAEAVMTSGFTLAYHRPVLSSDCLLGEEGTPASAHEFHSSTVSPTHDARPLWNIDGTLAGFAGRRWRLPTCMCIGRATRIMRDDSSTPFGSQVSTGARPHRRWMVLSRTRYGTTATKRSGTACSISLSTSAICRDRPGWTKRYAKVSRRRRTTPTRARHTRPSRAATGATVRRC
jgi:cobyrinic acid a,c-diamide synthase